MIIPYGHEHTTVRRLPWVTFTIMGLCVLVFVISSMSSNDRTEERVNDGLSRVFEYLAEHPYLELDPRFLDFLRDLGVTEDQIAGFEASLQAMKQFGEDPPTSARALDREREELEQLVDELLAVLSDMRDHAFFKWGVVPAHMKIHTLITYQFLHGGFWHLFGNLFFLFLAGPFIEDVWGRPLFACFYLLAGAVSALMFAVHYPQLEGPLIGASGSVAGVMGAFLIRYWNAKIRFFYWFFVVFRGTFSAPAWLMLPLWFLRELFFAEAMDVVAPGSGGGGVAHWAHVWGFAFGLAIAGAIRYYRVEERYIHESIEDKITLVDNTAVEKAMDAAVEGRSDEALTLLRNELAQRPNNVDAALALWNLATARGQEAVAAPHLVRVMRQAVRDEDPALVLNHWHEVLEADSDLEIDAPLAARIAEILHEHDRFDDLTQTLAVASRSLESDTPPGALAKLAKIAAAERAPSALVYVNAALAHPDTPVEIRSDLEDLVADLAPAVEIAESSPQEQETEMEVDAVAEVATTSHTLQTIPSVPQALEGGVLVVEIQGSTRRMELNKVQAIGVGGINREGERPFLVVDLLLDPPWGERPNLRALRIQSTDFDPRRLVGGTDALHAFRMLLEHLLKSTEAVPLPDPEAARGNPFRSFDSIEAYERDALGVG
jgi:membrane associated rhomboid family serine protease